MIRTPTSLRRAYADSPWGQLHHVEQGAGSPLLLLHQTPRSWDEFRELIPLLAVRHRVIAMDMLGFGDSAREAGPTQSIENMAAAAWDLLDALGVGETAVLGHHTGALAAFEMAASRPDRVRALIMSSGAYVDAAYRAKHANGHGVDEAVHTDDGAHLLELWNKRLPYYPTPAAGLLDRFLRDALAPDLDPAEGHLACVRYRMEERTAQVTAPTLLLVAGDDPFAVPELPALQAALTEVAQLDVAVIDGGTVALIEQKTTEVSEAVLGFLARVSVAEDRPSAAGPHSRTGAAGAREGAPAGVVHPAAGTGADPGSRL